MQNQEELQIIFNRLKKLLKKYEGPLEPMFDVKNKYNLWSCKDLEINGKKRDKISFATLIIQSNYVCFYFMPIYTDSNLKDLIDDNLVKLLKGKSCFHIQTLNDNLEKQIAKALNAGFKIYKKKGWI
ncbi:MAG: DUF1801 domain-containing protein [Patescibacteria group bacterium]|nr:DUF1801 domain-containing protein [Patescibacteria group bacterium]